jgi:hypothetical protein
MFLPDQLSGVIDRRDLSRRKPRMVGLGDARLCFSCTDGSGPSAGNSNCQARRPLRRSNALTRKTTFPRSDAIRPAFAEAMAGKPPSGRSPASAALPLCTRRGPGRTSPLPACEVTKTRLPQTMGEEMPSPESGTFQATF